MELLTKELLDKLNNLTIKNIIYQGKIDITEHINFQEMAKGYNLNDKEYNKLIDYAQKIIDEMIKEEIK